MPARRSRSIADEPACGANEARPPERQRRFGHAVFAEHVVGDRDQLQLRIVRQRVAETRRRNAPAPCASRCRAPAGRSRHRADRAVEPQHALGIDRIGIAHPGLDLGDGQRCAAAPRPAARRGRRRCGFGCAPVRRSARVHARRRPSSASSCSSSSRPLASCISRCTQREATVGAPSDFVRARQDARADAAASVAKSCADSPMARSGCSRPSALAHRPREPWIGRGRPRPCAFVQAAEDDEIETLQPRFQRPEDRKARMPAISGTHCGFARESSRNSGA